MYFYTPTRLVKLRIDVSYTVITKISFGKGSCRMNDTIEKTFINFIIWSLLNFIH